MIKNNLGNRMKSYYEESSKTKLLRRTPVIIRLDGCHFHTFTKTLNKPFDDVFMNVMQKTMLHLCENIQGCVLGYTQSDEITLVLKDYDNLNSNAWFDYEVQKLCSVTASMATLYFNKEFNNEIILKDNSNIDLEYLNNLKKAYNLGATFDSRCFNIPKEEVTNCILWRQLDAERNSINSLAQSYFKQKEISGLKNKELISKLENDKNVIWENLSTPKKRGTCAIRNENNNWIIDYVNETSRH